SCESMKPAEHARSRLDDLLSADALLRVVEPGIWSVLPADAPGQPYDRKAAFYDALIGGAWYNRLLWGTDHREYAKFARRALRSAPTGWHLDAGCGSLVGTHEVYSEVRDRPCLLVDLSLGMLRRGRGRLGPGSPTTLLQADLRSLPLRPHSMHSALCMGMLHLFDDDSAAAVVDGMVEGLVPRAPVYIRSLVLRRRMGDRYLRIPGR